MIKFVYAFHIQNNAVHQFFYGFTTKIKTIFSLLRI